jgi:4-hydroxybenzoate polyprenyltransferase
MFEFTVLFFGIGLTITGLAFLAWGVFALTQLNYKPRHTRSTYLPNRKR